MKKVLISCTYFLPNISGVSIYVDILAKKLNKANFKVSILTSKHDKNTKKYQNLDGIKIKRSKVLFSINKGVFMPMYFWDSYKMVKKADVIVANLPQVESVFLAFWSKILSKKFIVLHHCEFNFGGTFANKIISVLTYPIHLLTYIMADKIVSYTKDYAYTSIFLRFFKKKLEFILPPVTLSKPKKSKQTEIEKKICKKRGQKIIGFVGRIAWEKGIEVLIEAINNIKNIKLVLVGPYDNLIGDKSFKKLKNKVTPHKNIILWGAVKHESLVDFYKVFDCLVLASTNKLETFGIVQAEAMISGCPVIASDLPGVRMPVEMTGLGKIAKVADSRDLASKIEKVLETKYEKKDFDKAKKMFSLDKFSKDWQKCLE